MQFFFSKRVLFRCINRFGPLYLFVIFFCKKFLRAIYQLLRTLGLVKIRFTMGHYGVGLEILKYIGNSERITDVSGEFLYGFEGP